VADDSLPLRKSDVLFVVAVVMFVLTVPSREVAAVLVGGAVVAWIRFGVFGSRDTRNTRP
jgi:hypothetical protein